MSFAQSVRYAGAAVIIVALSYWLTLPTDTIAVDSNCEVVDLADRLTEFIHPADFWLAQRVALRDNLAVQERIQATADFGARSNADKIETPIEHRMDRLSERLAQQSGSQAAQTARLEKIGWMTRCDAIIGGRLQQ